MTGSASLPRLAVGALAGTMLFLVLTGGRFPRGRPSLSSGTLARRWLRIGAGATFEEVLWRAVVLGGLALWTGSAVALAVSSAGFALWHRASLGRACVVHLVTGGCFGAVFIACGLAAAVVAHATYNLLVDWAIHVERARARSP